MPLKAWPSISPISSLRLTWARLVSAAVRTVASASTPGSQQAFEAGAGQRVAGFTEQTHRGEAHGRVGVDQLQIGQGQAQGGVNAFVFFAGQLLVEEFQLRRFGAFLQLLRGGQTDFGVGGEQLVAGQRGVDQTPQAIVQAQGFRLAIDGQLALLQGVDQFDTGRIGLRGPGFQQFGLLHGIGGDEVFGVAGVGGHRQQKCDGENEAVKGSGHRKSPCADYVGASLPAIAVRSCIIDVPTSSLSRASQLPQGFVSGLNNVLRPDIQWLSCSSPHTPASCRCPE